jgi:hypothetical protein
MLSETGEQRKGQLRPSLEQPLAELTTVKDANSLFASSIVCGEIWTNLSVVTLQLAPPNCGAICHLAEGGRLAPGGHITVRSLERGSQTRVPLCNFPSIALLRHAAVES